MNQNINGRILIEFDAIANGGDVLLGYRPAPSIEEELINLRESEYSLVIQFTIDVFDPLGLRVSIIETRSQILFFILTEIE